MINIVYSDISKYHRWTNEYTIKLMTEYERFMILRANFDNISPSDNIDKLWHFHILSTQKYAEYCINKFGRIIHHNPLDALDQKKRNERLQNTIMYYKKKFGEFKYPEIWNIKPKIIVPDRINNRGIPTTDIKLKPYQIGVFIYHIYHVGCGVKKWKPNNEKYDRKIMAFYCNEYTTIGSFNSPVRSLKQMIADLTQHNVLGIRIYTHPDNKNEFITDDIKLFSLLSQKLLIAELDDMSFGFC